MAINNFIQLSGPFERNKELMDEIDKLNPERQYVKRIGIQTKAGNIVQFNGKPFEIGMNEILEFNGVEISSIMFLQDEPETTLIDIML